MNDSAIQPTSELDAPESSPTLVVSRRREVGELLGVEVLDAAGVAAGREPITTGDLAPLAAELWRDGCLRTGLETALGEVEFRVAEAPGTADGVASGLALHWRVEAHSGSVALGPSVGLEHVVQRVVVRCVEAGRLAEGDDYLRQLITLGSEDGGAGDWRAAGDSVPGERARAGLRTRSFR